MDPNHAFYQIELRSDVAPRAGFEPTTSRLTVYRSTTELRGSMVGVTGFEPVTTWTQTMHSTRLNYTPSLVHSKSIKKGFDISFIEMFKNYLLRYYIILFTKVNEFFIKHFRFFFIICHQSLSKS